jgi:hypothetical protein
MDSYWTVFFGGYARGNMTRGEDLLPKLNTWITFFDLDASQQQTIREVVAQKIALIAISARLKS